MFVVFIVIIYYEIIFCVKWKFDIVSYWGGGGGG